MNRVYARQVLNEVTGEVHTFEDDLEVIDRMRGKLWQAYEAGQQTPHSDLMKDIQTTLGHRKRVTKVHVIGDHVIVEKEERRNSEVTFGLWSSKNRDDGPDVVCNYATLTDALLASIILHNSDARYWGEANEALLYAKRVMGIKEDES